ncbi:MAG: hypothetical protein K1X42_01475 [Opitutaceae bacterium]|nr:hypothetical protein [Opitutaceae bacterium]
MTKHAPPQLSGIFSVLRGFVWIHPSIAKPEQERLARRREDTKEEARGMPSGDDFAWVEHLDLAILQAW